MFAADAQLDVGPGFAPAIRRQRHQLTHAIHVQADKRIARIDALLDIGAEEFGSVVAADAQRGLRQIVGAE